MISRRTIQIEQSVLEEVKMRENRAVIALSGGADSATMLYLAIATCHEVHAISVNYGQRHKKELECAKALCQELNIKHTIIDFDLTQFGGSPLVDFSMGVPAQADMKQATTVVPYRNSFIILLAAAYAKANNLNTIYIGATYEDLANYEDCRPVFFDAFENAARLGGTIHDLKIDTPFIDMTKERIIQLGHHRLSVPYEKTWTCYEGGDEPCMQCDACRERMEAFRLNGIYDPLISEDNWNAYIQNIEKNKYRKVEVKKNER